MRGYIYVVEAAEVNRIKIGRSRTHKGVMSRVNLFQCGSPCRLDMHSVSGHEDYIAAEKHFHSKFRNARFYREWFDSTDPLVIEWLDERVDQGFAYGYSIEVTNGIIGRPPSEFFSAIEFLICYLDARPNQKARAREVIEVAQRFGHSKRTIENAKKKLGIKSLKKHNDGWWWILP